MGRGFTLSKTMDKRCGIIALIRPHGDAARSRQALDHLQSGFSFCGAVGLREAAVDHKTASVLHQDMAHIAKLGLFAFGFFEQPGFRIRSGPMRIVLSNLSFEVNFRIPTTTTSRVSIVAALRMKALQRGPSLDKRPIDGKMLIGQQTALLCLRSDRFEEQRSHFMINQTFPIFGEGRMIPDRIVHGQAHKPTKQQIVIQLLYQHPFATNGIQDLKQKGS